MKILVQIAEFIACKPLRLLINGHYIQMIVQRLCRLHRLPQLIPHAMVSLRLGDNVSAAVVIAGNGSAGSASNQLNGSEGIFVTVNFDLYVADYFNNRIQRSAANMLSTPCGIFVSINFDLYVADYGNNRIQLFRLGQSNGITVAGNTSVNVTIGLSGPTGVVLDANNYLFIVDRDSHQIIRQETNGFRCLIGCSGSGLSANQLFYPSRMTFDSNGNIYVADSGNNRIQKFCLSNNSCEQITLTTTVTTTATTTVSTTVSTTASATTETTTETTTTTTTTTTTVTMETSSSIIDSTTMSATSIEITSTQLITNTSVIISTTTAKTSTHPTSNQNCYAPNVTLVPGTSTLGSPIQIRRSQDVSIVSIVKFNCNQSFSMTTQWTVKTKTLSYGIYELNLTVTISGFSIPSSVYIEIISSDIVVNVFSLGTPMITSGYQQDLLLNPGAFSTNLDRTKFNANEWSYKYYCRIYGLYMFPQYQNSSLTIDDMRNDLLNPSCLSNRTGWKFDNSINSSFRIFSGSLQPNRMYQFMVSMTNRQNPLKQVTGSALVKVEYTHSPMVAIGCVISTMCVSNLEYQLVNPTTQVALYSFCVENCSMIQNIQWTIYYGIRNSSSNVTQWNLFNQTNSYANIWFFGTNTTNFTATDQLFLTYSQWTFWRFEVVYTFTMGTSASSLDFLINQSPQNGSCSVNPLNGTTSTLFDLTCSNWFDTDGIKDYSLYIWTTDQSKRMIVAYSALSTFQIRFPSGDEPTYEVHLVVNVRDQFDCLTEYQFTTSIHVQPDMNAMNHFINDIQNSSNEIINNPFVQLLGSENQNIVGQVIQLFSNEFNKLNEQNIDQAISNGIPLTSISVSSLGSTYSSRISTPLNISALTEYNKELNSHAQVREYLIKFIPNLAITTSNSIILQAQTMVQLTKATNQLTRNTLTIAIDRCYQLTKALYSMSTQISYEDTQTAATQLLQCATNLLTAVNGPLQERMHVLDVDFSRATSFPRDYDADLELPWSNLNLFADGNDFSWSTIEKNRNIYYQKQLANEIISKTNEMTSLITSALNINLNVEQNFLVNTSQTFMLLERKSFQSLSNKQIKQIGNAQINLPSAIQTNQNHNQTVLIQVESMMEPLSPYSKSQSNTNLSTSISLTILDENQQEIPIQTDANNSIEIIIPRDPNLIIPSMILYNVTSNNSTDHHQQSFYLHYVNITTSLPTSVHIEIHPLNVNISYLLIHKFDGIPQLNSSINQIDGWKLLCPADFTNESIYRYFLDNQQTVNHHALVIGLRELDSNIYCLNSSLNQPPITNEMYNFTSDYELRAYTSGCYYLDENNQWKSDGLIVGSLTNHYQTQCFSKHLTKFTGSFNVLPQPINWSYVFANADFARNKTIYLTVICVLVIYIIFLIYARHYDKKDIEKLGVTPLPDNHSSDEYFYQIIVFTGQRKDAGTKSNVCFMLHGNEDQTPIRTFADPHRRILQRGGIDAFIMAVPHSLGLLNCIRIWHDNSGKSSASWFLKYIIIRDLQTMEKFHFISQRWFAVEKDDGKIERILPVAGLTEKNEFSYILSKKAYHSISDGHLWFSIFSRPPSNQFTRVQRCTCCFVLFFVSMFLNIMYYDLQSEAKMSATISLDQILIGIIVEVCSLVPSLLLIQIFRRLRARNKSISSLRKTLYQIKPSLEKEDKKKIKSSFTFPWWFIFIAYGLCILLVGMSAFFLIVRGIEFGDLKTQKWLISIISGFFSSIFLTQPIKILTLTLFFAFFCRKSNDDKEATEYLNDNEISLDQNEEYLHENKKSLFISRTSSIHRSRLTEGEIAFARERRLKEIQMWSILRELFLYLIFFSSLSVIVYSQSQYNSFLQVDHLQKYFDYNEISTKSAYWQWLEESFVDNIRAQEWYNGVPPRNLSGFINDKSNRLIGWITMRQLRVQSQFCSRQNFNFICVYDYNTQHEEINSFEPGWINQTEFKSNSTLDRAFQYQSADQLDTYTINGKFGRYNGGGYVYEFRGRLSDIQTNVTKLHEFNWIDDRTRAVIIQLNLYNPNVQLFTSVIFLTEFLSTGGMATQLTIQPIHFYTFTSLIQFVCLIVYMIFIIYLMFQQIQLKSQCFRQFWSIIDCGIIICSWVGVGIYIWRYQEYSRIGKLFSETNGYTYINLQLLTYINEILRFLYSFSCFFGTIKFIRLCRYNLRIFLFIQTVRIAGKELMSFAMMFSVVFISFNSLFYLLFLSKLASCSTFLQTTTMLFEMTLMQFDGDGLVDVAAFLAPLCFSIFMILVVFTCLSMFLSIINQSFQQAKQNVQEGDHIYSFIFNRFLRWTGLNKPNDYEIHEEKDIMMREEYHDPVEHFPEKMDQLLTALNRVYISQGEEK
ncbi:hypothetical protein I4U23_003760 [Adineta vaga]|nr:hypothetical protein I4U23_003760 [Adineta vaga]